MKRIPLSCIIPALLAVLLAGGCTFEMPDAPDTLLVSAIEPAEGAPGSEVTIIGEGFGTYAGQVVAFTGGAAEVRSVSPNRILTIALRPKR